MFFNDRKSDFPSSVPYNGLQVLSFSAVSSPLFVSSQRPRENSKRVEFHLFEKRKAKFMDIHDIHHRQ